MGHWVSELFHDAAARHRDHRPDTEGQPDWLEEDLPAGFHTLKADGERLRVFKRVDGAGRATVVAQPTEIRDEIGLTSAEHTLVPLLLLPLLMVWMILRIVRRELPRSSLWPRIWTPNRRIARAC